MSANVSADRGAVAAGRDVVADLIVTGDRNTFFVGGYQRLSDAYIDPREVFERVDVAHFVGREAVIAELDDFLAEQRCGYFVVEAPAGLGKSALMAHLVASRGWVHHFSELAPGEPGIAAARMSLAAQLIRAFDLRDGAASVLSEAAASRVDFLRGLLSDAAARLERGEKLVFVVDALDESGTRPGENVLGLPRVLPEGVFAVVSKRLVPVELYTDSPRRTVQIEPGSDANLKDIRAYIAAVAPARLVEPLLAKSGGLWIYVRYALQEGPDLDPDALPDGLWGWYHRFWHTWARAHPAEWHDVHLPMLAALAAARESLTLPELARFAAVDAPPPDLPAEWRPYLTTRRERPRRYRLYHASLEDYLHGRTTTQDSAEQDFADDLGYATRTAHARIADHCLAAADPDAYGLAHLAAHLRRADRPDELFALVEDPAWRSVHLRREPSGGGFLGNLTEAWDCAVELDRGAIAAGEPPRYLQREIGCALGAEDVRTSAAYLPPALLARLVAAGVWTPDQALASAALSPYPYGRAKSLAAVLPYLPEPQRVAELQAYFAWAANDRERALRALAPHVPDSMLAAALRFAAEIELDGERGEGLGALAPYLPAPLLADAVANATAMDDPLDRVEALIPLVPHAAGELRERALDGAVEALVAVQDRVVESYLGRLFGGLAGEAPERLLALAVTVERPASRAEAVVAVAGHVDADQAARALAAAIAPAPEVLAVLASHLPPDLAPAAVTAAEANDDPDERAKALAALAPVLSTEHRDEALAIARDPHVLADTIVALAPVLDDAQLARALEVVTGLEDTRTRAWALGLLYHHLPAELQSAARAAADAIDDHYDRERALEWIRNPWDPDASDESSPQLTDDELSEALAEAREMDDAHDRSEALEKLAPQLPDAMLPDALRAALAPLDTEERAELWALLAERGPAEPREEQPAPAPLPAEERAGAIAAATEMEDAGERARALADLCEGIPAAQRSSELIAALEGTLDDAAATLTSRRLSRAVRALAPHLPDALLPRAFAIATRIRRERRRRYALQDMAVDLQDASPAVLHVCLDIALRASLEHLETTRCVRWLLPIIKALDRGGVPWRQS